MRTGPGVDEEFKNLEEWGSKKDISVEAFVAVDPTNPKSAIESNALSGGERNRLFLRADGNYKDVTLVSGVDFREDGRGFVLFDYDRDGFLDLGVTSPNAPRFRVARNRLAEFQEDSNGFVELRLEGGQTSTLASTEWSSRQPFGATIRVTMNGQTRMFHYSCGEGLSIQNADRIHIGLGQAKKIDQVEVFWPSGKCTTAEDIAAGSRITLFEKARE